MSFSEAKYGNFSSIDHRSSFPRTDHTTAILEAQKIQKPIHPSTTINTQSFFTLIDSFFDPPLISNNTPRPSESIYLSTSSCVSPSPTTTATKPSSAAPPPPPSLPSVFSPPFPRPPPSEETPSSRQRRAVPIIKVQPTIPPRLL